MNKKITAVIAAAMAATAVGTSVSAATPPKFRLPPPILWPRKS